ncbi:Squalene/phytoene synthase [Nesidiocoris tenuis]|uniref:15-cis-phytoene synthase n=1 Tax=Nesidiocoris tenuis TaxID=355587 RepID=A0ABN7A9W4_9HEMI|nr:Squalene/phytoene synthase [Nesidiocoris tenuis]
MRLLVRLPLLAVKNIRNASSRSQQSPADYCVNLVKQYDHENFLCTLLLPNDTRRAAFCIRAFNIEVSLIGNKITEDHIGLMRYKWWEDALNGIYSGGSIPKHPVVLELNKVIKDNKLLKKQFTRMLSARRNPLPKTGFKTMKDMETYAEESTSPVYYLILQAAGVKNVDVDHAASHLGKAQGVVNLVRSIPHHITRRQVVLPEEILVKHDVPQETFMSSNMVINGPVRDVLFDVASSANTHNDKARQLIADVPKKAKPIFLPAVAVSEYLERLRDADFDILHPNLQCRNASLGFKLFWRKLRGSY